jgi:predicted nicotinamide N-methyase
VHNKRVLEVGSGTGVSGLAAAYLGAALSVLTDLDYTLDNLRANVDLNYPPSAHMTASCSSSSSSSFFCSSSLSGGQGKPLVRALDWSDPSTYTTPLDFLQHSEATEGCGAGVRESLQSQREGGRESFGAVEECAARREEKDEWDVVLGADVVWLEALVEPLVSALRALCSAGTVVILSHQVRPPVDTS